MKNSPKTLGWSLIGGISLLGMLGMLVSAADVNLGLDPSNAIQHIRSVRIEQPNNSGNYATISRVGMRLLKIQTNSNILLNEENEIFGNSVNSAILGGRGNRIEQGGLSTIIAGFNNSIGGAGEANTILGGNDNWIYGSNFSTIAGGKNNYIEGEASTILGGEGNVIRGNYSAIVGINNLVEGNNSVAMGANSRVIGNNSFLWTNLPEEVMLEGDDIFAVVSERGVVINSDDLESAAQLTVGGPLVVTADDDDQNVVCGGDQGEGIIKAIFTGGQYCLCSCDGKTWSSMFGNGYCQSKCMSDGQPVCGAGVDRFKGAGDDKYIYQGNSGSCLVGDIVEGVGAILVDRNNGVHWSCQIADGVTVSCSAGAESVRQMNNYAECNLPWGGTIAHGEQITAWESQSPEGQCKFETRTCHDGTLDGSYQYASCNRKCKKPWNNEYIPHGQPLTACKFAEFGESCQCQNRTCNNGVLNFDAGYNYPNTCPTGDPKECFYEGDGAKYPHMYDLVTYSKKEGQCPDDGCDKFALTGRCYNGMWLNTDAKYWKYEGDKVIDLMEEIKPEEIKINLYKNNICASKEDPNAPIYTLLNCPDNGTCSTGYVSFPNNDPKLPLTCSAPEKKFKLDQCNAGYRKNGDVCEKCGAGTYSPAGSNTCASCPAGYSSPEGATSLSQCTITCQGGSYVATAGQQCIPCGTGTQMSAHQVVAGTADGACYNCSNSPSNSWPEYSSGPHDNYEYVSNGSGNNCTWACGAGYYKQATQCATCKRGSYTSQTSDTGANAQSDCYINCPGGQYRDIFAPNCTACSTGQYTSGHKAYYSIGSSCSNCTNKPDNAHYTSNGSGNNCQWACDPNYTYNSSTNSCVGSTVSCGGSVPSSNVDKGLSTYTYTGTDHSWVYKSSGSLGLCEYRCSNGYELNGNTCVHVCRLGNIDYSVGDSAQGYAGNVTCPASCPSIVTATCQSDGTWSPNITQTTCQRVSQSYNGYYDSCPTGFSCGSATTFSIANANGTSCSNVTKYQVLGCGTYKACQGNEVGCYEYNGYRCRPYRDCDYNHAHGSTRSFYASSIVISPATCISSQKTCDDGEWVGGNSTHTYTSCAVKSSDEQSCFLQGTKVLTSEGYKNIEDLDKGELVLSYNTFTKEFEYNPITAKYVHENNDNELYELTINGDVLKVTELHPFYVFIGNKATDYQCASEYIWVSAKNLKVGARLLMSDGTHAVIENILHHPNFSTVYNLSVANNHNFFVGNGYLVHNEVNCTTCPPDPIGGKTEIGNFWYQFYN